MCAMAIADGVYTIEEDTKFIDLAIKLKISMNEINSMRAVLLKKCASTDTIFSVISKANEKHIV